VDNAIGFPNTYPLDSDLSGGERYPTFEQLGPDLKLEMKFDQVAKSEFNKMPKAFRSNSICPTVFGK